MSAVLSKETIRARIDLYEALEEVLGAIDDLNEVEFDSGEPEVVDVGLRENSAEKRSISFAHGIPQSVAIAGLQAMKAALEAMLEKA